jgi:septum site-determining protein MinC
MIEQTPCVRLKGVGNSLWLTIEPNTPFERIQKELTRLFDPLKHLAGATRVVLDTGGGQEDDARRRQIGTYLKEVFNLNEVLAPPEKTKSEEKLFRMNPSRNVISSYQHDTLLLAGRVRSGQNVHAKKHLVIIGDVLYLIHI